MTPTKDQEKEILKYICDYENVTFVELIRKFEIKGDQALYSPYTKNVVVWSGLSTEFCKFLIKAIKKKILQLNNTHALVYFIDGGALKLPIVGTKLPKNGYKTERWAPMVINPGLNFNCSRN